MYRLKISTCFALCFIVGHMVFPCVDHHVHAQDNLPDLVDQQTVPSFKDILQLRSVGSARISPDGTAIAFANRTVDWDENQYRSDIWLARNGEAPFQLTRTPNGSSGSPVWSPDGSLIAFLSDRADKTQIFVISPTGGEAWQLTHASEGVSDFRWSPDGTRIVFASSDEQTDEQKSIEEEYGRFEIEDAVYRMTHLWSIDVTENEASAERLTEGRQYTVGNFEFSPDGTQIAFDHRPNPLLNSLADGDISLLDLESKNVHVLVEREGPDTVPVWSPDGTSLLFSTSQQDLDSFFYLNNELAIIDINSGEIEILTAEFDEDVRGAFWNSDGIFFTAYQKTIRRLFHLDPDSGEIRMDRRFDGSVSAVDFADDNRALVIQSDSPERLSELFLVRDGQVEQITTLTDQVSDWALGHSEVVTWTSLDGAEIEGVLYRPDDYDPEKKYPLLVVIHGGPTGISRPSLVNTYVYPIHQWLAKGAVVLMPNYRGSAGYGEAFRSLNVRNLGVGDMWDVMSGVEYLVEEGIADPARMGAMGWSQGGYISAFLTTNTDRFRAISVGAGISNWMTYYVNTDIHQFTRQYLKATPWDDPNIYANTSPMTNIRDASTPTLIQHGEFDQRVPIPNARELFQGLQDNSVPTRLIVYNGFGHGITRPKERLAAVWHNWQWFSEYVWDEEVSLPIESAPEDDATGDTDSDQ